MLSSLDKLRVSDGTPNSDLAKTISLLFESSEDVTAALVPQVHAALAKKSPESYEDIINRALEVINSWDSKEKAQFISGHPRIGEVNNLSKLSAAEQASTATSPDVLARLSHLNCLYETKYPGLRYITFVNGRGRAEIVPEMEGVLEVGHSMEPDSPSTESIESLDTDGVEWQGELDRAVEDIGRIAKSRVQKLTGST